jgi:hypothetical protein
MTSADSTPNTTLKTAGRASTTAHACASTSWT